MLNVIFRIYYFEAILVKSLFTRADQTSRFACKRKLVCWAGAKQISYAAFADLGTTTAVTDDTESSIEAFLYANCMSLILLWLMLPS